MDVKWHHTVVLIHISLVTNDVERFLWRKVYSHPWPIVLIGLFVFFLLSYNQRRNICGDLKGQFILSPSDSIEISEHLNELHMLLGLT